MNTLEFLQTILPEEGWKMLALARPDHSGLAHKAFESLEVMAKAIDSYDRQETTTVYHACAAYKEASYEVEVQGKTKRKYRGEQNWYKAKAFWIDMDCGAKKAAEGKGYATKSEAAKAIFGFCHKFGFPEPMVVDSGGGLHCYWPLTQSIGPKSWNTMASGFKAALKAEGVLADPTRTADLSSVLRPVGATNKKPGREPRRVAVKRQANPCTPAAFAAAVAKATENLTVQVPTRKYDLSVNDDLTAHLGPQLESSAREVADHCAQVAQMRDNLGQVGHDHWFGVIGIIKHCIEGIELAHEWSNGPTYDPAGVDTKYETWNAGPTKCEFFRTCNPSACEGCQHNGKITSPIQLGRIMPEPVEMEVPVASEDEEQPTETVTVPELPHSYAWSNHLMVRMLPDMNNVLQPHKFCHTLFYPTQRIRKPDGTFAFMIRMHLPDHRTRDFEVDTAALAASSDLLKALSRYELMPTNNKDASMHLTAYIRDSIHKLMTEQREVDTLTHFGWRDDMSGFLLGDRLYHSDGTVRKVYVGGAASTFKNVYAEPRGTLEEYSKAVNFLYNRPSSEAAQYVFCNVYGSLLTPFGEDSYNGALVAVNSGASGKGKTTVWRAALYGICDANGLIMAGREGATPNARWGRVGAHKNIPVVLDELTDIDAAALSSLAYTVSQGAERARMTSSGGKVGFAEQHTWKAVVGITANEDMHSKLAQHNANTQAEAVRMISVNFSTYGVPILDPTTLATEALEVMRRNMGHAGDAFVRYIVTKQDQVAKLFVDTERRLTVLMPQAEYRFFRNHATCTLTAARILIDLGVVEFDYDALEDFTNRLMHDLMGTVVSSNTTTPEDAVGKMLRDLSGRVIVTAGFRDTRTDSRGPEESLSRLNGVPCGRRVLGMANPNSTEKVDPKVVGKVFLAKKDFNDWCAKNRIEPKAVLEYCRSVGWLTPWSERFNIGRGTAYTTGSCAVYVFDFQAMEGAAEKTNGPALVDEAVAKVSSNG